VGEPLQVNLGRHGMAWGRGLQRPESGPIKHEGDGRTPAGIFRVGPLFGYASAAPASASPNFSYIHIRAGTECVEDPRSPAYNSIIDSGPKSPMLRADGVFRLGFVIEQNAPEVVSGAGSCVFFHVQRGPLQATSGCTSISLENLESVVSWLKPELEPLIVELPEPQYARLKDDWALPRELPEASRSHASRGPIGEPQDRYPG
jgi:zinc D-Ala-D-Ala dipeptidase